MHIKKYGLVLLFSVVSLHGMEMEGDTSQKRQLRDQETLNLLKGTIPTATTFQEVEKKYREHFGGGEVDYSSAMVQFLLSNPENNDLFEKLVSKDGFEPEQCTIALREVARDQNVYAVNKLVQKGVSVSQKDTVTGRTILRWALERQLTSESYVITRIFLNHPEGKELINHQDNLDQTALSELVVSKHVDEFAKKYDIMPFVDLLIEHGADPSIKGKKSNMDTYEKLPEDRESMREYLKKKRHEYLREKIVPSLQAISASKYFPPEIAEEIVSWMGLEKEISEMKAY